MLTGQCTVHPRDVRSKVRRSFVRDYPQVGEGFQIVEPLLLRPIEDFQIIEALVHRLTEGLRILKHIPPCEAEVLETFLYPRCEVFIYRIQLPVRGVCI